MSDQPYRIFGMELSPYSVKVRSYFRYKGIPHEWIVRNPSNQEEFSKYAKLPLVPLVVTPEDEGIQDSTPIIERMETVVPERAVQPDDPTLAFLSALIEEYADEWGNKHMFHYRWWREADQQSAGRRIAEANLPDGASEEQVAGLAEAIIGRMVPRLSFVGSNETTQPILEDSYQHAVELVERHLAERPYLFGGRPALADFGLYAQLYEAWIDPTAGGILERKGPRTIAWIERMLDPPAPEGDFETWETLGATLEPLLADEVGALFLPWSDANAKALAAGADEVSLELAARPYAQKPQKYHAKSLGVIRQKYAALADRTALDPILERTGCFALLQS